MLLWLFGGGGRKTPRAQDRAMLLEAMGRPARLQELATPYLAPRPQTTVGSVAIRMYRSSQSDRLRM
jgi:hypothetical protein